MWYTKKEADMVKYKAGNIVDCVVSGIADYGIFCNLEDYYSGLIHISEISNGYVSDINNVLKVGDHIKAKILAVDEENLKLKLSIKDLPKFRKRKYSRRKIIESGSGFGILEENLDKWIDDALRKEEERANEER